jgi:hypothetical protein
MKALNPPRKIFYLLFLLFFVQQAHTQLCIPNPMYTSPGVHPDTTVALATGCVGTPYHQEFTIVVPADTVVFGIHFPINFIMVDSVGGLPPGILYLCNPGSCSYPGGTTGCFQLYGTPTVAGAYHLTFYVHGQATVFGSPAIYNFAYTGYKVYLGTRPTLVTGNTPATCNAANGTAWVQASGSSGYGYSWNTVPPSNNDSIFNLSASIYQVTVTDLYNCASVDTVIVNNLGAPQIDTILITEPLCFGGTNGSATVMATGGTPPYDYLWGTGDTTATLNNVANGGYTVSVTDQNGCLASSFANIGQPPQLLIFATSTNVTCFGSNDGALTTTATLGGTGGYTYSWTTGDSLANVNGVGPGSYAVTVTDAHGCTASATATITQPPALVVNLSATDASCFGFANGGAMATVTGGIPGYTYAWSNGDTTGSISGLSQGVYTLTVTDTTGCSLTNAVTVNAPPAVNIFLSGTNESIFGALDGAINATISGGTPGYTYSWSNGAITEDISGLAGGTYILQVTDTQGCTGTDTLTITTLPGFGLDEADGIFAYYPNPARDYIYLELHMDARIDLLDLGGKTYLQQPVFQGKQYIHLPALSAGMYMLVIRTGSQNFYQKLIIE